MSKVAFIFPGQGSQAVGMGKAMSEANEKASDIFREADKRLGFELSELIFNGPAEDLTLTVNAQPALLTTSIAILEALAHYEIQPDYTAGHSLGEYSALVAAGAMDFKDAVYAVRKRGEYMEEAVPAGEGAMAAVMGMKADELKAITDDVTNDGNPVQLANLNSPGQIVISGSKRGVEEASELAKEKGARRVIPLKVSGPFHSSLMKPAADKFADVLKGIDIRDAMIPVVANVTASPVTKADDIESLLIKQLYSPVLWEDSVKSLIENGVDTFVEIGAGNVLSGLVKKIDRSVTIHTISDPESLEKTVSQLKEGM